jgi:hypothetical protein
MVKKIVLIPLAKLTLELGSSCPTPVVWPLVPGDIGSRCFRSLLCSIFFDSLLIDFLLVWSGFYYGTYQ